jgi:hypothetical protein
MRGVRMHLDFAHHTRLFLGLYEIEINQHLRKLAPAGAVSFDIGAQQGYDALLLAKLTGGRVASFEADSRWLPTIEANLALNPARAPLVTVVGGTVGTGAGQVALDDWASGGGFPPEFMKIDVDGGEVDVLNSASGLLAQQHPSMIIETHTPALERECIDIVEALGYRTRIVDQRRFMPDHRPIPHNRWLVAT